MKKIKKGFTLVELLVVIAILAILASVSVIGYLSFTEKAKLSNVETEMAQIREVVRDSLLDGSEVTIECGDTDYTLSFSENKLTADPATTGSTPVVWAVAFPDLAVFDEESKEIAITKDNMTYKDNDAGVQAVWTFSSDSIEGEKIA